MPTCRVCLRTLKKLRFDTGRAAVCGSCVAMLNTRPAVAEVAQQCLVEMLRRGIVRRATAALDAPDSWRRERAKRELGGLDAIVAQETAGWVNRLLADPKNTGRDFKLLRAHRRHLLHFDRPKGWGYPTNWKDVAAGLRAMDDYRCTGCGRGDGILDVHHIVYVYHFGTHRQENLATLCRPCHEAEHGHALDFGESVGTDGAPIGAATYYGWVEPTGEVGSATDGEVPVVASELTPTATYVCDQNDLTLDRREARAMAGNNTGAGPSEPSQALPPVPQDRHTPEESAWCILSCGHCQRIQRVFVVGDQAVIVCVFCRHNFFPGPLSRLRRSGW